MANQTDAELALEALPSLVVAGQAVGLSWSMVRYTLARGECWGRKFTRGVRPRSERASVLSHKSIL